MGNLEKQRLLETTDTAERIRSLIPVLERQLIERTQPAYFRVTSSELREEFYSPN